MSIVCLKEPNYVQQHVTAITRHRCEWCHGAIEPGTTYVRCTEYPGGDAGYADAAGHPVRMAIHAAEPCHHCPLAEAVRDA